MIDENAFGALFSYFWVEDDEYALEREPFVVRFRQFREILRAVVREHPLGSGVRAFDLGHAWYFEVADGDLAESLLVWVRRAREKLKENDFETVAAVTYGGRWVDDETPSFFSTEPLGQAGVVTLSHPSEPFRRALYADAASRHDDEIEGWGPGLYLDTEAVEPLGIRPKNAPTVLRTAGATFYRVGS